MHSAESVSFLDNGDRLPSQGTLVDKGTSLENDAFEGQFDGVFEEDDIPRDDVNGGDGLDVAVSEDVDGYLVEGHRKDLVVELHHLVQIDDHANQEDSQQGRGEVVVGLSDVPEEDAENEEDVEGLDDLEDEQFDDGGLMDHHRPRAIGMLQGVGMGLGQSSLLSQLVG